MESLKTAFDVIVSPFKGFEKLKEKKTFWLPFLLTIFLMSGAIGYYSFNVDWKYILTKQFEETGTIEKLPAENRDEIIDKQAQFTKYIAPIGSFFGAFVYLLIISLYLFTMAKVYASDLSYKEAMVIVGNSYFVFFLWSVIFFVILFLTDFKTTPIQDLLPTNLYYFFSGAEINKKLAVLLKIDFFNLWFTYLLGVGFSVFTGESLKKSLLTAFVPYVLIILISVFMA